MSAELTLDEKEHVTRFFWNRKDIYKFGAPKAPAELSFPALSFDIDTAQDLEKFRNIASLVSIEMTGLEILNALRSENQLDAFSKTRKPKK